MKYFLPFYLVISTFVLTLSCADTPVKKSKSNQPNVILIMTDDQGWGDLGFHDNDSVDTPVLDAFAGKSVSFDRFYVSPVCAPTRASLLTGRYHLRTGTTWVTHRKEVMRSDEKTIAEYFKEDGYATGIFGKWHNGEQYPNDPTGQGFDEFFGFSAGHWNNYFNTSLTHNGKTVKTKGFITDVITDACMNWISAKKEEPFFAYVPYNAPHSPMQIPDSYFDKYKAKGLTDFNAAAYGMCENIDENIGRIFKQLDDLGLTENTIVLFTTDNGPNRARWNGFMKGHKGSYNEGGVRVPLFVRWPKGGIDGKRLVRQHGMHIDILPTLIDLCDLGGKEGKPMDGKSLAPILKGERSPWPERHLFTFPIGYSLTPNPGAVRTNQWRLVLEKDSTVTLYDMIADPAQTSDLAAQRPDMVDSLGAAYLAKYKEVTSEGILPPPIPVGHKEAPIVVLPSPEGKLSGDLKFFEGMGWANDWVSNWSSKKDSVVWKVDAVEGGKYGVEMMYCVKEENINTVMTLQTGNQKSEVKFPEAHFPEYLESPDRVTRWEVYEKEWKRMPVGEVMLKKGESDLVVKAQEIPGKEAIELRGLILTKL